MTPLFSDRRAAGRQLAQELSAYQDRADVIVLGLPRGGVPVAFEVARALGATLDVLPVRKLGVPGYPELAMGAIAPGDVRFINQDMVLRLGVSEEDVERVAAVEQAELQRRERAYRDDRPPQDIGSRIVILVDDGLATGATMRAAIAAVRQLGAERVVVAVPVAPADTCRVLAEEADEVVCPAMPEPFRAIGCWYEQFPQVSDHEVRKLLEAAETARAGSGQ